MKVISLIPAATEIACAIGAGHRLCAISHECDWPAEVRHLPRVTRSAIAAESEPRAIDDAVRELAASGGAPAELLEDTIAELRPDAIITQALCDVCAVSEADVRALAARLEPSPRVIAMTGTTLEGVLTDIAFLAGALGSTAGGRRVVGSFRDRMLRVHARLKAERAPRPRVAVIEWTEPPFAAGHWVPDLVRRAGGVDVLSQPGDRSRQITAAEVRAAEPDLLVIAPCGRTLGQARDDARAMLALPQWSWARTLRAYALDGGALLSRGGPRLVEAIEVLAAIMHPELFEPPADTESLHERIELDADDAHAAASAFDRPMLTLVPQPLLDG